jgi:CHAD domain-containing protein
MPYEFHPGESFQQAFNRVAAEELSAAIDLIEQGGMTAEAVHDARKSLKRLRSLLRLARPALKGEQFRGENRRLRDAAASLSGARDAEVMLATFDQLVGRAKAQKRLAGGGRAFRELLHDQRNAENGRLTRRRLAETVRMLKDARDSLARLRLRQLPGDPLELGLTETMRQGRRSYADAYRRHDPHDFHDYRKSAQRYYRQLQLLTAAWPQLMAIHIDAAKQLADILGEEHDLSVLHQKALQHPPLFASKAKLKTFAAEIEARQRQLREAARQSGYRLFMTEQPKAFARRVTALFRDARPSPEAPTPA